MRVMLSLIAAVVLVGCGERKTDIPAPPATAPYPQQPASPAADVAELRQIAEQACLCARSRAGNGPCWRTFNDKVRAYEEAAPAATACVPITTSLRCFDVGTDDHFCIATGHQLVGGNLPPLCTDQEVEVVETAYAEAFDRTDDHDQAMHEAERIVKALLRGEALSRPAVRKGCGA